MVLLKIGNTSKPMLLVILKIYLTKKITIHLFLPLNFFCGLSRHVSGLIINNGRVEPICLFANYEPVGDRDDRLVFQKFLGESGRGIRVTSLN